MSVAVEAIRLPHTGTEVGNVNATEITDIGTSETDEKPNGKLDGVQKSQPSDSPRAKPKKTYSKEEIFAFKESPLTKTRPSSLSGKYCNRDGIWDPELWYYSEESEKRSASPIDSKKKLLLDGIVLSPQGRSFARGCQVALDGRNKVSGRVGRGWDPKAQKGRVSPSGDTRFDRRNDRYAGPGKSRRRAGSYDSQPEWFTHGPSSQQDMIELKGFDHGEKENKRKRRKKDAGEGISRSARQSPGEMFDESNKFDINEFFDMAENALPISGIYENQITSRFSQWFHNERRSRSGSLNASLSNSQPNSRRSSIADELAEIAGLTLSSPVRTPTPDPDFLFAPIVPASESCRDDTLLDVLQNSEIDVQPLLDSVIPHKTVKGAVNLADLEGEDRAVCKESGSAEEKQAGEEKGERAEAFMKLIETMKASGNLPEKPTPTIPDIPPHLLPRPPSSKEKNRTISPSLNPSRSPSPLQLLQDVIRRSQSPTGFVENRLAQSPVGFAGNAQALVQDPRLMSSFDALRNASPVADTFSTAKVTRPLTPEELYGPPPVLNINSKPGSDLFEFTASATNIGNRPGRKRRDNLPRYVTKPESESSSVASPVSSAAPKFTSAGYPVISQSFVPTSVLRKIHSDKHDQKSTDVNESKKWSKDEPMKSLHGNAVVPLRQPLYNVPTAVTSPRTLTSPQSHPSISRANLMSPEEFTSPKTSLESKDEPVGPPELLTPHRLPLPVSPASMTPLSLPLPGSPLTQETPKQRLLTPRSLPLPQSPLVNGLAPTSPSNGPSNFGIRPLPKGAGLDDSSRARARTPANVQHSLKKPSDQPARHSSSGNNMRRFPQGQVPFRGQVPMNPMIRRPGMVPNPYNMNAANLGRAMHVHPTALALALRNQQYQMARAAAVAAATAAVNRPPVISPAQAAAALMLNQQRANASAALHGLMPQVNPRMFPQAPLRPNLPPALQHQHHVVHRSEPVKDNSLSKWFSDAVLNQSQAQPAAPGRGAKVLSVEELERHA